MLEPKTEIIYQLLNKPADFLSGRKLAEDLGVSRVSVWKHVESLVNDGFKIQAVRNRGYQLEKFPETIHEVALRGLALSLGFNKKLYFYDSIDSTSSEVERQLTEDGNTSIAVIANRQTNGRGRRGNHWFSEVPGNIALSIGIKSNIDLSRMGLYTLWIGIRIVEYLREYTESDFTLKWPNDIYFEDRKLAGILTEAKIEMDQVQSLITGLGVNVNASIDSYPDSLKEIVATVHQITGVPVNLNDFAARLLVVVWQAANEYITQDLTERVLALWPRYDYLMGSRVRAKASNEMIEGVAMGIDEKGQLSIQLDDGETRKVHSGEVTLMR